MNVDSSGIDVRIVTPTPHRGRRSREKTRPGCSQEMLSKPEHSVGPSWTCRPCAADAVRRDIHLDIGVSELLTSQCRSNPAHDRANPRNQLARAERLGDVIVGAGFEAANAVAFLAARSRIMIGTLAVVARRRSCGRLRSR